MKPCSKRSFIINIFEGKEIRNLKKILFTVTVYKYDIPFVVPSLNIFWNKGFQNVHDVFYRVSEVLLYFLINTSYKNNLRNFLGGKMYINYTVLEILKKPQTISIYWFYLPHNNVDLILTPLYVHKLQFVSNKLHP